MELVDRCDLRHLNNWMMSWLEAKLLACLCTGNVVYECNVPLVNVITLKELSCRVCGWNVQMGTVFSEQACCLYNTLSQCWCDVPITYPDENSETGDSLCLKIIIKKMIALFMLLKFMHIRAALFWLFCLE